MKEEKPRGYDRMTGSLQLKEARTAEEKEENPNEVKVVWNRGNEYPDGTPWGEDAEERAAENERRRADVKRLREEQEQGEQADG